ncbi:MAG: four helix bundle protein [Acidobacteriales bacterium]|nr:four helix bundle protein [Terriglobales bacterium]
MEDALKRTRSQESDQPRDICDRTFNLAVRIVKLCHYLDGKSSSSRVLSKQLLRAGTSIGANVEKARAGQSRADFISKNAIALKEAREARYRLRLIATAKAVSEARLAGLRAELEEVMKVLGAIIVASKRNATRK